MLEVVRRALKRANLSVEVEEISLDEDLFALGLKSFDSVQVMLAIEEALDIEFPEEILTRTTFETIASIVRGIDTARAGGIMVTPA